MQVSGISNYIIQSLILLPAILVGLTFHEYAHGKVADMLGDPTPRSMGRLTLNPLPHIDWLGFLMLLVVHFGWAKPVQWNPNNIRRDISIRKGMMLVSLAGPAMNFCLAFLSIIVVKLLLPYENTNWGNYAVQIAYPFVWINLVLMIFNMIPIPPLDGSKVLMYFLPEPAVAKMANFERYGTLLLFLLIVPLFGYSIAGLVLTPMINLAYNFMDYITFFV